MRSPDSLRTFAAFFAFGTIVGGSLVGCAKPVSAPPPAPTGIGIPAKPTAEEMAAIVQVENWGETEEGDVVQYFLTNKHGMKVTLINLGATITSVDVPDRTGNAANVTLSFNTAAEYEKNAPYFGGICGRFSNRIAKGRFSLDGMDYTLAINNDPNHLHGGTKGFNRKLWTGQNVEAKDGEVGVRFTMESPDGDEGYPGTLKVAVTYSLTDANELRIDYTAQADKPTVLNLTNHAYWNLAGAGSGAIDQHELTLSCDKYLPVDDTLIPTGKIEPVEGTPFDFRKPVAIGSRYEEVDGGYDLCYVINRAEGEEKKTVLAARVHDPKSGRVMEILTTEPGIQFYTGNFLEGTEATGGFPKHAAFCLECQHYPDSPNRPEFPTTVLQPGEVYTQTTIHRFSVEK